MDKFDGKLPTRCEKCKREFEGLYYFVAGKTKRGALKYWCHWCHGWEPLNDAVKYSPQTGNKYGV